MEEPETAEPTAEPTTYVTAHPTSTSVTDGAQFVVVNSQLNGITQTQAQNSGPAMSATLGGIQGVTVASVTRSDRRRQEETVGNWDVTYNVPAPSASEAQSIEATAQADSFQESLATQVEIEFNLPTATVTAKVAIVFLTADPVTASPTNAVTSPPEPGAANAGEG